MKTIITSLVLVFGILSQTTAQDVNEKKISMSLGPQNSFYVEIPGSDLKMAEKTFYEIIKEYGKLKENKKINISIECLVDFVALSLFRDMKIIEMICVK